MFSQEDRRSQDRMIEFWEHLHQVDINDGFVNKLVIDCVNFCKTGCVFTGGQEDHAGDADEDAEDQEVA